MKLIAGICVLASWLSMPSTSCAGNLVAAWGDNTYGQTTLPIGVNSVKAISAGGHNNLGLKSDGTVFAWGDPAGGGTTIPPGLANVRAISASADWAMALKADGTVAAWGAYGGDLHVSGLSNITAIAAGWYHWLALKPEGTIVTWGNGNDSYNPANPTNIPPGLSNVTAIAAGVEDSLVLKSDGTVVAWGWNIYGQTNVPAGLSNVIAIAAGYYHNLALKADGTVVAWGGDFSRQTDVPPGLSNVVAIAAGAEHSLALKADGTVVAWGAGGTAYPYYDQATVPPGLSNVTAISAGGEFSLALVSSGPLQITQDIQPPSLSVPYASNASNAIFSVVASSTTPLSYQWFLNGSPVGNSSRISGATTASLSITDAQFTDIGTYTVVVSNPFGSVISSGAALTVIGPPFFTQKSPANQTVPAGKFVALSVLAQGTPPLSYQWSFNGTNLPGATNSTVLLANVQPGASGDYSIVVTNLYGIAKTDFLLTVTDSVPYFLIQPVGQLVPIGQSATLSVLAGGSLPLSYQWRYNGVNISGATNTALTLTNLNSNQTGYYDVDASNPFGDTVSAKVLLNVVQTYLWGTPPGQTKPTNEPFGLINVANVAAGSYHVLALKRDGTLATWASPFALSSVTNIPADATNVTAIAASGNSSMALKSDGTVDVWGDNSGGQIKAAALASNIMAIADSDTSYGYRYCLALKSNGTVIELGSGPQLPAGMSNVVGIAAGSTFVLALKSDGTVVNWGVNSPVIPPGLSNVVAISANTETCLALKADGTVVGWGNQIRIPSNLSNIVAIAAGPNSGAVLKSDGSVVSWGFFAAIATNFPPSVSNVISLAVSSPTESPFVAAVLGDGSPFVTLQPASQTTTNGAKVQFHGRAVGAQSFVTNHGQDKTAQPLGFQWLFDSAILTGATNADLTITNVHGSNAGNYQFVATNALGAVTSRVALLTILFNTNLAAALDATNLTWVSSPTNAPWFAQNSVTHDGVTTAQSGAIGNSQRSILQTAVTGPGTLTFWWKVSSEEGYDFLNFYVDNTNTPLARISGEVDWQEESFTIAAGTHLLEWIYAKDPDVSVGQDAGWVDQVTFTPKPPIIMQQPVGQTNWMGSSVAFQAAATGAPLMNFQWMKNGTNLPNAQSAILTLTNLTRRDSGTYALQISNAGGSVMSSNATLVVCVPQRLSAPILLHDGSVRLMSCDADGGMLAQSDLTGFEAQASKDLVNWVPLTNALTLTNGMMQLRDTDSTNYPRRYYRIVERSLDARQPVFQQPARSGSPKIPDYPAW